MPRQCNKRQRQHFANKSPYNQSYGFPSSHVQMWESENESWSVLSDSLPPQSLYRQCNSSSQNTGVGSLSLLQGIFPTQWSNPGLPHYWRIIYQLSHKGSPRILDWVAHQFSIRSFQKVIEPSILHCRWILYQLNYQGSPQMWELDHKEGWAPKKRHFQTMVLEKILESPLDYKEIKPVNPEANQSSIFTGRTDDEAETPLLWQSDVKSQLWKIPWCWDWLKAGEGDERGWDGWMTWLIQRTWAWAGIWWGTGKPGVRQYMYGIEKSRTWKNDWTTTRIQMEMLNKLFEIKIRRQIRSQG